MRLDELLSKEGINEVMVYIGKPPVGPEGLGFYIELARSVSGELLIKPVREDLLLGENDEVYITLRSDFKKGINDIIKKTNFEELIIKSNEKTFTYEYDVGNNDFRLEYLN